MSQASQVLVPTTTRIAASTHDPPWLIELKGREATTWKTVRTLGTQRRDHLSDRATYVHSDVLKWLADLPANSLHAVVTDPPYGMIEYDEKNHAKLREGRRGGVCGTAEFRWLKTQTITALHRAIEGRNPKPTRILQLRRVWSAEGHRARWTRFHRLQPVGFDHDVPRIHRVRF